eukprot:923506-Amphidinium_carterae.1
MSRCKDSLWPFSLVRLSATLSSWGSQRSHGCLCYPSRSLHVAPFDYIFCPRSGSECLEYLLVGTPGLPLACSMGDVPIATTSSSTPAALLLPIVPVLQTWLSWMQLAAIDEIHSRQWTLCQVDNSEGSPAHPVQSHSLPETGDLQRSPKMHLSMLSTTGPGMAHLPTSMAYSAALLWPRCD